MADITEKLLASRIKDNFRLGETNRDREMDEYRSMLRLVDNERVDKDYDWMSDLSLPEYASQMLTQLANDAKVYFSTREYTEVYLEDESVEAKLASKGAKECINRTLNQRHIGHYMKYMRSRTVNYLNGMIVGRCWWEQETEEAVVGTEPVAERDDLTGDRTTIDRDVIDEIPIVDRFNWDMIDPRNVSYDDSYVYSLQEKKWVVVNFERTREQLEASADLMNYINLDQLDEIAPPDETDASRRSYNEDEQATKSHTDPNKSYDIYEQHGMDWCKIVVREDPDDDESEPTEVEPGYDESGIKLANAELHEVIQTTAVSKESNVLIRFQLQPYMDGNGNRYRPLMRGLNFIHPSRDGGLSDGTYARELQQAINDTMNMMFDRAKMSLLPTIVVDRYAAEDNETLYQAPGHMIEIEDPKNNLVELDIDGNMAPGMNVMMLFRDIMRQVLGSRETRQGMLPEDSSTTATAVAAAEGGGDTRENYRSLTFEHTFLSELYWMILQMTHQFAFEQTAMKLFGSEQLMMAFNPVAEYFYKPVTQGIETEYSKAAKRRDATQIIGYLSQIPNPNQLKVLNLFLGEILETYGKEYSQYKNLLFDENAPPPAQGADQQESSAIPTSNQAGVPQSGLEETTRRIIQ